MSEPAQTSSPPAPPEAVTQEQLDAAQRAWAETDPFNTPLYQERGDAYEALLTRWAEQGQPAAPPAAPGAHDPGIDALRAELGIEGPALDERSSGYSTKDEAQFLREGSAAGIPAWVLASARDWYVAAWKPGMTAEARAQLEQDFRNAYRDHLTPAQMDDVIAWERGDA